MKTVIYLSSKQVMILTGDKFNSIKKAYRFEFKESCLINGVITNYDVLKKELGDFVKNNKSVLRMLPWFCTVQRLSTVI